MPRASAAHHDTRLIARVREVNAQEISECCFYLNITTIFLKVINDDFKGVEMSVDRIMEKLLWKYRLID